MQQRRLPRLGSFSKGRYSGQSATVYEAAWPAVSGLDLGVDGMELKDVRVFLIAAIMKVHCTCDSDN